MKLAYGDVSRAFHAFLRKIGDRPFILVSAQLPRCPPRQLLGCGLLLMFDDGGVSRCGRPGTRKARFMGCDCCGSGWPRSRLSAAGRFARTPRSCSRS